MALRCIFGMLHDKSCLLCIPSTINSAARCDKIWLDNFLPQIQPLHHICTHTNAFAHSDSHKGIAASASALALCFIRDAILWRADVLTVKSKWKLKSEKRIQQSNWKLNRVLKCIKLNFNREVAWLLDCVYVTCDCMCEWERVWHCKVQLQFDE